ncbi:MAG: 16S rRNA (adenine(1518)-N(6)/adenine(1519)-N(6))-dimethyltransferase RsmA [Nitrososphaerales archaeon]|nr:16S rRNA (adenine(1518)-N(6)/adenine(1519)-N(6))-dimethyltransferase RsmA [Nitrososphaerales archaeon]
MDRKRRRLGQHYVIDEGVIEKIIKFANISNDEIVFEIGSGEGQLTERLCRLGKKVISCEIDRNLYERAKVKLEHFKNLELICADGFTLKHRFDVLVANLPYSQSKRFILWLSDKTFKRAVVTVQKEFAEKLLARPRSKNYRAISVFAQALFSITPLEDVSPDAFYPRPKVTSTIILIEPKEHVRRVDINILEKIFSFRGRRLSTMFKIVAKRVGIDVDELLSSFPFSQKRVEDLSIDEIIQVADRLSKYYRYDEVYRPSEDTLFLCDKVRSSSTSLVLEIGVGSGLVTEELARFCDKVVGSEINREALIQGRKHLIEKGLWGKVDLICCDGASAFRPSSFPLIVFNPPYLPSKAIEDLAVDGGRGGIEVANHILLQATNVLQRGGKILFVLSSLSSYKRLLNEWKRKGFKVRIIDKKRLFFEELLLIEFEKPLDS